MSKKTVTIRLPEELVKRINENNPDNSFNSNVENTMNRYYRMLNFALRKIELSKKEWIAIYDVLNGIGNDENDLGIRMLYASIEDAEQYEGLSARHGIDAVALAKKLREADLATLYAIYDKAERFWNSPQADRDEELAKLN